MKKYIFFVFFLSVVSIQSQSFNKAQIDSLALIFQSLRNGTAENTSLTSNADLKCGLEMVNILRENFEQLNSELQAALKPLLDRPALQTSFVSPNGFFRIHYDLSGPNEPGYSLNLLGEALDSTFEYEVNFLGYPAPPSDNTAGGDALYDIYLVDLGTGGSGLYGYTQFESELPPGSNKFTSYMVIDNDFSGFYSAGINGAQVTVAHEFHHAIQGGNYIFRVEDSYFYEITSTAMEEFVFDSVNDYYAYMPDYFNSPGRPFPNNNGYNLAVWNIYLKERFGFNILKRQWELLVNTRALNAVAASISEFSSTFKSELNRFGIWTFYTDFRSIPGKYFEEAEEYPLIRHNPVIDFTAGSEAIEMSVSVTSNNFIRFVNNADSLSLIVTNGDYLKALDSVNARQKFNYTLYSDSISGNRKLSDNYSADFTSPNIGSFSAAEILNNRLVFSEDSVVNPPIEDNSFTYPSPFFYNQHSFIYFPIKLTSGENYSLTVFTSGMELIYRANEVLTAIPDGSIGIKWNARGNDGNKLATGIYIFVIEHSDKTETGKVTIFNE